MSSDSAAPEYLLYDRVAHHMGLSSEITLEVQPCQERRCVGSS